MAFVETEQHDNIFVIKIARPEKRNAVNTKTAEDLANAFRNFEIDGSCNVAVLCGKGGTFCAGYDFEEGTDSENFIKAFAPPGEGDGPMGPTRLKLSKPVIGALEGFAVAGGMELALMCDLRVAAEDLVMGFLNRRFGLPMLDGGAVRLPYIVGLSRALDLIMTGRPVSAQEAHSMGLVNRVVPKGRAVEEAITLAKSIASFSAGAMRVDRKTAYYSMFNADSFYDALTYEYRKAVTVDTIKDAAIKGAKEFVEGIGKKGSFDEWLD